MTRRVLVVIGSRTRENGYGVTSGLRVAAALRRHGWEVETVHAAAGRNVQRKLLEEPPDLVVPIGFGPPSEDGHVCAVARMAGVPCAGPTPAAGSLMQDKAALSRMVDALFSATTGIRSPRGCVVTARLSADEAEARIRQLRSPLVVKPAWSGSSERLGVFHTPEEAFATVSAMLPEEGKVLVQELEQPVLAEISCTMLDCENGPRFLPIVELRRNDVLVLGPAEKFGHEGLGRHIIPARITPIISARVQEAVLTLNDAIGARGLTRTDILVRPDGDLVILEVNGIPGLLESSIACEAASAAGISFDELAVTYAESAFIASAEPRIWD